MGAGAAGLMAAKLLSVNNRVVILEGDSRLGGRIHTITGAGFSQPVEAGAEFIHGHLPLTLQLLTAAGIQTTETGGEMYTSRKGKWVDGATEPTGWATMMQRMHELKSDTTLDDFLQQNFSGDKYTKLCERARGYAQGYDLADPEKVSVFFLRDEWGAGWDDQYRVGGGYGRMVAFLAAECSKNGVEIVTGAMVKSIHWANNQVTAITASGQHYHAEKAVITVPVSVLQQANAPASISFEPAIGHYMQAAQNIGYGGVIKVVFEFKTAFWNQQKPDIGFVFCNECIPTWWTQAPNEAPIITGWLGGPTAEALAGEAEDLILENGLQSLSAVFGLGVSQLKAALVAGQVFNWCGNQFSLGAYSYATPLTKQALQILNTPLANTLFFAGEALYNGAHPGTVEAALVSGKQAAELLMLG